MHDVSTFSSPSTTRSPSLASNASQRGSFISPPATSPLPHFKRESEGEFLVFTHPFHHPTPSLASNPSRRGCVTTRHVTHHHPFHHPFPLPRFKCKSEGEFYLSTRHVTPPSLQTRVGGVVFSPHPPIPPPNPLPHPPIPPPNPLPRVKCES